MSSMKERLEKMKSQSESAKTKDVVAQIAHTEVSNKLDFNEVAEKFKATKTAPESEELIKVTSYIRKDVYTAFESLCVERGDKKKYTNEALEDFVIKKYRELSEE